MAFAPPLKERTPAHGQDPPSERLVIELADYGANRHHIDLATSPEPVTLADLLEPSFWAHRAAKFHEHDLIRVIGAQREFDIMLVVTSKSPGGLLLEPWPKPAVGTAEWDQLMKGITNAAALTEKQMATELQPPIEPPATTKKKVAA